LAGGGAAATATTTELEDVDEASEDEDEAADNGASDEGDRGVGRAGRLGDTKNKQKIKIK